MNFGTIQVANIFVGTLNAIEAYFGNEKIWGKSEPLCFTAEEANSTLHLEKYGSPDAISLETSTDGRNWTDYTNRPTLTLSNVGDKVYFRAKTENQTIGKSDQNFYRFIMTGKISASGNIQTLLKADGSRTDAPAYCYC